MWFANTGIWPQAFLLVVGIIVALLLASSSSLSGILLSILAAVLLAVLLGAALCRLRRHLHPERSISPDRKAGWLGNLPKPARQRSHDSVCRKPTGRRAR